MVSSTGELFRRLAIDETLAGKHQYFQRRSGGGARVQDFARGCLPSQLAWRLSLAPVLAAAGAMADYACKLSGLPRFLNFPLLRQEAAQQVGSEPGDWSSRLTSAPCNHLRGGTLW
jgi:hypothetical protein